jgi:peptide/nickel transport system ATP-binding protein
MVEVSARHAARCLFPSRTRELTAPSVELVGSQQSETAMPTEPLVAAGTCEPTAFDARSDRSPRFGSDEPAELLVATRRRGLAARDVESVGSQRNESDVPTEPLAGAQTSNRNVHLNRRQHDERDTELDPPLVRVIGLSKRYQDVLACDDVTLDVRRGEILGLVGESGSGKTTLVRCLAGLTEPDAGTITFDGIRLGGLLRRRQVAQVRAIQMVFQNPDATLNPSHTISRILSRAISRLGGDQTPAELGRSVQLAPEQLDKRPARLSGGQRQRAAIGRALAGHPQLVLCDEPVSALDASVQAGILNLLSRLQQEQQLAYLFISHDLGVIRYIADRIGVMYLGQLLEIGHADDLFALPRHPYTNELISSTPSLQTKPSGKRVRPQTAHLVVTKPTVGCRFFSRCPHRIEGLCDVQSPPWQKPGAGHMLRCHLPPADLARAQQAIAQRPA